MEVYAVRMKTFDSISFYKIIEYNNYSGTISKVYLSPKNTFSKKHILKIGNHVFPEEVYNSFSQAAQTIIKQVFSR